jgi:hypothetical protein
MSPSTQRQSPSSLSSHSHPPILFSIN